MNIQDIGTVFGMIATATVGGTIVGDNYISNNYIAKTDPPPYDQVYVLVSVQKLQLLYAAEDELAQLEAKKNPSTADIARMATLRERIRNLKGE